jgi:zinc transporter 2
MIGEIIGGALSNSLAIMTDAAHMLSDFASFLISLFAIWMANRPPTKLMSFGWHRMEVLGALVSVVVIWILTGVLVYEAVLRVIHQDYEINADIMLITAAIGVYVNTFMVFVLHQHGHGHGHSHGHSHGHGKKDGDGHGHSHGLSIPIPGFLRRKKRERGDPESGEGHSHKKSSKNINVQAAFVHVIGDLIQSIGVVIAAFIIRFKPEWKLADPICTFLFSILVIISTLTVMRDALRVIMEGTPRGLNYQQVLQDLQNIKGVKLAHSLHMWSLTIDKPALAAHLAMDAEEANFQDVLSEASKMLHQKYGFHHTTLQVEDYKRVMGKCDKCQSILPSTTSASWLFTCFCSSGN